MRIVCVSDTHNLHNKTKIPDGDIFIHAGDITAIGEKEIIIDFNNWLGQLPHKYKIVIAGNHDFCFENESIETEKLLTNAIYLNDSGVEIEGFSIWGSPISPISPRFGGDWAFNIDRGQKIRNYWKLIPENTDILITHCPPFGILDMNDLGDKEGCKDLLDLVQNKIKPTVHIFGHIHEAYGQIQVGQTKFINASIVGLQSWIATYKFTRQLRIIAISIFQTIKQIRKNLFGVPKDKLHNRTFSYLHWTVKNQATIIDI
jgi:Icc-related predicted phosphoesterase